MTATRTFITGGLGWMLLLLSVGYGWAEAEEYRVVPLIYDPPGLPTQPTLAESSYAKFGGERGVEMPEPIGPIVERRGCVPAIPAVRAIFAIPRVPSVLLVQLEDGLKERVMKAIDTDERLVMLYTGHVEFDALNAQLGVRSVEHVGSNYFHFCFDEEAYLEAGTSAYSRLEGIQRVERIRISFGSPLIESPRFPSEPSPPSLGAPLKFPEDQVEQLISDGAPDASGRKTADPRGLQSPRQGDVFRDCEACPEMVVVPAGSFMMGSPSSEAGRYEDEGPVHLVTIAEPFAVGLYEVTREEFGRFVQDTGHQTGDRCVTWENGWEETEGIGWADPGFGQTTRDPAVCVNWTDARAYARWLSRETELSTAC